MKKSSPKIGEIYALKYGGHEYEVMNICLDKHPPHKERIYLRAMVTGEKTNLWLKNFKSIFIPADTGSGGES